MKKKFYLLASSLILQTCLSLGISQINPQKDEIKNNLYQGITSGLNYSWIKCNTGNFGLNNCEFNLGYSINRYILKKFNIQIQALAGIKIKKPYDNRFDMIGKRTSQDKYDDPFYVIFVVDEFDKILSTNHYYIELPISVGYQIIPKLEIKTGYAYRYYFGSSNNIRDFFINNHEGGLITGFNYKISEKFIIGANLFINPKNIYSSISFIAATQYSTTLKTRYIQIEFKYNFN